MSKRNRALSILNKPDGPRPPRPGASGSQYIKTIIETHSTIDSVIDIPIQRDQVDLELLRRLFDNTHKVCVMTLKEITPNKSVIQLYPQRGHSEIVISHERPNQGESKDG